MSDDELIGADSMTDQQSMLEGYPGAALLVSGNGDIISTNSKGGAIASMLRQTVLPALK